MYFILLNPCMILWSCKMGCQPPTDCGSVHSANVFPEDFLHVQARHRKWVAYLFRHKTSLQ